MAEVKINHAFVSVKPDSFDTTLVSSGEWNDNEIISGGSTGQIVVRDTASDTGATWVNGPAGYSNNGSYSGGNISTGLAPIVVTRTTPCLLMFIINVSATLASTTTFTMSLYRGGTLLRNVSMVADNFNRTYVDMFFENVGTDTYSVIVATAGPNFTSANVAFNIMALGTL